MIATYLDINISSSNYLKVLAGPAFIAVFSVSGVLLSILSDKLSTAVSRVVLVGLGAATFSAGNITYHLTLDTSLQSSLFSLCADGLYLLVLAAGASQVIIYTNIHHPGHLLTSQDDDLGGGECVPAHVLRPHR